MSVLADKNCPMFQRLPLVLPCVVLLGLCSGIEVTEQIIEHTSPNMTHMNMTNPHTERITTPSMPVPPDKERDTTSALPQKEEKKFIPSPMLGYIPDPEIQQLSKSNPDHLAYLQQEHMKLLKYKNSQDKTNPKLKTGLSFPPNPHLLKMFHDHKSREVPRNNKNKNDDTHKSADTEYDYLKLFKDYMSDSNPQDFKTPQKESFKQEDYFKYIKNQDLPMNDAPLENSGKNVPYDENIFKAFQNQQQIPEHRQIPKEEYLKDISSYKSQPNSDDNFDIEDILKAIDQYKAQPEENKNLFDNGHLLKSTQNSKPQYSSDENSNDQNVFNLLQNVKLQHNPQHQQIGKEEFLKDFSSSSNQAPSGGSLSVEEILRAAQNYKPQPEEYKGDSGDFPKPTTNFNPHYNSDESFNGKYSSKPIPNETPEHFVHPGSFSNEGYNPGTFVDTHVSIPPRGQQPIFTSSGKFESDIKSTSYTSSPVTNSHPYMFQISPSPVERPGKKQVAEPHRPRAALHTLTETVRGEGGRELLSTLSLRPYEAREDEKLLSTLHTLALILSRVVSASSKGPNTMSMLKKAVSLLATFIPLGIFLASISPSILHINSTHSKGPNTMSMLKKAVSLLATFIPLGIFLASISPSILHINSTQSNLPHRQRSLDGVTKMDDLDDPLLAILDKYGGTESLDDPDCENRIFCEMSRLGKQPQANLVQKAFWYLANDTPSSVAESLGLREVFKAVRTDACNIYNCNKNSTQPINS
uniref:Uncharacterized protein n=1 Tax=Timema bartmani TaxID=61472 RepID=A0A7R9I6E4_9NEOP|nr:unnamed protein product [Timema bartmani]